MRIHFESVTCTRCNGAKVFRCWGHIHGGRCFKCGGTGRMLTRRGAKARAEWDALGRAETWQEIRPGYMVQAGIASAKWYRVTAVVEIHTPETARAWTVKPDGTRVPREGITVTVGKDYTFSYCGAPSAFRRPVTAAAIQAFHAAHAKATTILEEESQP